MAFYQTTANGYWNSGSTWVGSAVPPASGNNTYSVNHNVTISVPISSSYVHSMIQITKSNTTLSIVSGGSIMAQYIYVNVGMFYMSSGSTLIFSGSAAVRGDHPNSGSAGLYCGAAANTHLVMQGHTPYFTMSATTGLYYDAYTQSGFDFSNIFGIGQLITFHRIPKTAYNWNSINHIYSQNQGFEVKDAGLGYLRVQNRVYFTSSVLSVPVNGQFIVENPNIFGPNMTISAYVSGNDNGVIPMIVNNVIGSTVSWSYPSGFSGDTGIQPSYLAPIVDIRWNHLGTDTNTIGYTNIDKLAYCLSSPIVSGSMGITLSNAYGLEVGHTISIQSPVIESSYTNTYDVNDTIWGITAKNGNELQLNHSIGFNAPTGYYVAKLSKDIKIRSSNPDDQNDSYYINVTYNTAGPRLTTIQGVEFYRFGARQGTAVSYDGQRLGFFIYCYPFAGGLTYVKNCSFYNSRRKAASAIYDGVYFARYNTIITNNIFVNIKGQGCFADAGHNMPLVSNMAMYSRGYGSFASPTLNTTNTLKYNVVLSPRPSYLPASHASYVPDIRIISSVAPEAMAWQPRIIQQNIIRNFPGKGISVGYNSAYKYSNVIIRVNKYENYLFRHFSSGGTPGIIQQNCIMLPNSTNSYYSSSYYGTYDTASTIDYRGLTLGGMTYTNINGNPQNFQMHLPGSIIEKDYSVFSGSQYNYSWRAYRNYNVWDGLLQEVYLTPGIYTMSAFLRKNATFNGTTTNLPSLYFCYSNMYYNNRLTVATQTQVAQVQTMSSVNDTWTQVNMGFIVPRPGQYKVGIRSGGSTGDYWIHPKLYLYTYDTNKTLDNFYQMNRMIGSSGMLQLEYLPPPTPPVENLNAFIQIGNGVEI